MKKDRVFPKLFSINFFLGMIFLGIAGCGNADFHTESVQSTVTDTVDETILTGDADGIKITGMGAEVQNGTVQITEAGTYRLSGDFPAGIEIHATKEDTVSLILDNAVIKSSSWAAIYNPEKTKLVLNVADQSENRISDGESYTYESADQDKPNAAVFSKGDLTFVGKGSLTIEGNYEDAVRSKGDLCIESGSYSITAVKDGIQGKDSVWIQDGTYVINAGQDAVKATNDSDSEKGWVLIDSGSFQIRAGDDAFHAESSMTINDGEIQIQECYEGIEGLQVFLNGGNVTLNASDDGINAAGGTSESPMGDNPDAKVVINGGTYYVSAQGDGIDSNGNLEIHGGFVYVEGPESDGDGALDYVYSATMDGGTLIAVGSSGMAMGLNEDSSQGWILYNLEQKQQAGTGFSLTDEDGTVLAEQTPQKAYQSILISVPELAAGKSYTLTCKTTSETITLESGFYSNQKAGFGFGGGGPEGLGEKPEDLDGWPGSENFGEFKGEKPEDPDGQPEGDRPEPPDMPEAQK